MSPDVQQGQNPAERQAQSVWRWNFGIGMVFVGAVLTYAIQFHDWKLSQVASILGVALIIAGIVLLTINLSRDQPDDRSLESAKWLIRLVWVAAFGMGVIVLYSVQYQHWVLQRVASTASVGLIAAGAAWLTGALLGFIFGLPHTREGVQPQTSGSSEHDAAGTDAAKTQDRRKDDYRRSTSLEEVSDWLTKMIVGVGLTQLNKIPGKLQDLAGYVANGLAANSTGAPPPDAHALAVNSAFALGICIYFAVDGFLFGFLWACLDLLELFRRLDSKGLQETKDIAVAADRKAETGPDATYEIIKARDEYDSIVAKKKRNEAYDVNQAKEFIKKLGESSALFPGNRALHIVLANLYYETGEWDSAVAVLRGFIATRVKSGEADDDDVATAWFNLSCFYSVRSETPGLKGKAGELLKEAEVCLEGCFETAKKSGPSTLEIHLQRANGDDELEALRKAGTLAKLLNRYGFSQATSS